MRMPDVNVLIYAHRADDPAHGFFKNWIEVLAAGPEPFGLSSEVATAFVRIVTHPAYPLGPTPLSEALSVIDSIRRASGCRFLTPGVRHWETFRQLCDHSGAVGKRVGDAKHAAIALEHGCVWVTRDADFQNFVPHGLRLEMIEPGTK